MSKSKEVPFGFDDAVERVNLDEGEYEFYVGKSTKAYVSRSGNPTVEVHGYPIDRDDVWPIKMWLPLAGKSAGMTKRFLKHLGFDPHEFVDNLLAMYDGGSDAKDVAAFWHAAAVPQIVGRHFGGRIIIKEQVDKDSGEVRVDKDGNPYLNSSFKSTWEL